MEIKVQVETGAGEVIRYEKMPLTQLNERKPDDYFYTPLGGYEQCELCSSWYAREDRVSGNHPRVQKSGFCSHQCADEADDEARCSDDTDWYDYQDFDHGMNY